MDNSIERDTIISTNVIVGRGVSSVTFANTLSRCGCPRKNYNKWFMSKVPSKKCTKESSFKLKARMQEMNAVQEYEDVDLHKIFYQKGSVRQTVTDEEVMNVIG